MHSKCFVVIVGTGGKLWPLYGVGVYGVHVVLWCWCVVLCCVVLCCVGVGVLGC